MEVTIHLNNYSKAYYEEIDTCVLKMLKTYDDFYMIMKFNKGIHPIDLMSSIDRLYRKRKIHKSKYRRIKESALKKGRVSSEDMVNIPPVPHLLDYDWRFSREGLSNLAHELARNIQDSIATVVFIGTPSLFKYCDRHFNYNTRLILVDINAKQYEEGIDKQRSICINADINEDFATLNKILADYIVMDPPWYYNYYKLFFNRAAMMIHEESQIYCIMPPRFTRANAENEKEKLLEEIASKYGLQKIHYFTSFVSYHTPPYERNALRENGINCAPSNWRTGDLLIVQKLLPTTSKQEVVDIIHEMDWIEENIKNVRIKMRPSATNISSYDISLVKIYSTEIYPSVKRSFSDKKISTSGQVAIVYSGVPICHY